MQVYDILRASCSYIEEFSFGSTLHYILISHINMNMYIQLLQKKVYVTRGQVGLR